jgi:hypothetical protein
MEHHTPENIQDDIDFLVGLESDMVQFMLMTPLPVTALYRRHKRLGKLDTSLPFEEWHGQKKLNYQHPSFDEKEPEQWLSRAFAQDYHDNSSSMYRIAETSVMGYEHLESIEDKDRCLEARMRQFADQAQEYCLMLPTINELAVNERERRRARELNSRAIRLFGRTPKEHLMTLVVLGLANRWRRRLERVGDVMQPKTIRTKYVTNVSGRRRQVNNAAKRVFVRLPAAAMAASIMALWS